MSGQHRPLAPELAAFHGLPPAERDRLVSVAKSRAMRFTWAVKARNAAEVERVTRGMPRDEWAALAVVLADAIQPGSYRLLNVTEARDDRLPIGGAA
jgi:hypothetical protein